MTRAVAILNYNGLNLLKLFLRDNIKNTPNANTYLIDNNSSDDSVNFVRTKFPDVKIIQLKKNFGYAGGYNESIKHIDEDLIFFLNNDAVFLDNKSGFDFCVESAGLTETIEMGFNLINKDKGQLFFASHPPNNEKISLSPHELISGKKIFGSWGGEVDPDRDIPKLWKLIKKSKIDKNSKVNHLTYIGDTEIGKDVNIGAGTITCNYDGFDKHKTTIGDEVFVGSNTMMVAPVTLGKKSTTGAGTVLSKNLSENTLGITRIKEKQIPNWNRKPKIKK